MLLGSSGHMERQLLIQKEGLYGGNQVKMTLPGWALIHYDRCLHPEGSLDTDTGVHRER